MAALLTLLALPVMILNFLGGIVGGIWLIILGDWFTFIVGLIAGGGGVFAISIMMMPGMIFIAPAGALLERGQQTIGAVLGLLGLAWTYAVMTAWCVGLFAFILDRSDGQNIWPYALWAYGAASGPWTFMAQKEAQSDPSSYAPMTAFAVQLGCISMMMAGLLDGYDLSISRLLMFFVPFMAVCFVLQGLFVVMNSQSARR